MRGRTAGFCDPASSQHNNSGGGGSPEKNFDSVKSQLRALATLRPIWGRVGQGAFELCLPKLGSEGPLGFWIYLLRKDAYRDFLYIILKHTQ